MKERRPREVDGYVGFANLPNQVYRKAVKKGFEFSLMVVGKCYLLFSHVLYGLFVWKGGFNDGLSAVGCTFFFHEHLNVCVAGSFLVIGCYFILVFK